MGASFVKPIRRSRNVRPPLGQSPAATSGIEASFENEAFIVIKEYEYLSNRSNKLGEGGFGAVFRGRNRDTAEIVAIKIMDKNRLKALNQENLKQEAHIMEQIQHPNIVAFIKGYESPDHLYLIIEYCNGGDLASYIRGKGELPEATIRSFVSQIRLAMQELRRHKIIHRDLKPQNILLSFDSSKASDILSCNVQDIVLKIADFGLARYLEDGDMAKSVIGTPVYAAPEVLLKKPYDVRVDLFAIGVIVYECATSEQPYQAPNVFELVNIYRDEQREFELLGTFSKEMSEFVTALLQVDPAKRMSFDEFVAHPVAHPMWDWRGSNDTPAKCYPTTVSIFTDLFRSEMAKHLLTLHQIDSREAERMKSSMTLQVGRKIDNVLMEMTMNLEEREQLKSSIDEQVNSLCAHLIAQRKEEIESEDRRNSDRVKQYYERMQNLFAEFPFSNRDQVDSKLQQLLKLFSSQVKSDHAIQTLIQIKQLEYESLSNFLQSAQKEDLWIQVHVRQYHEFMEKLMKENPYTSRTVIDQKHQEFLRSSLKHVKSRQAGQTLIQVMRPEYEKVVRYQHQLQQDDQRLRSEIESLREAMKQFFDAGPFNTNDDIARRRQELMNLSIVQSKNEQVISTIMQIVNTGKNSLIKYQREVECGNQRIIEHARRHNDVMKSLIDADPSVSHDEINRRHHELSRLSSVHLSKSENKILTQIMQHDKDSLIKYQQDLQQEDDRIIDSVANYTYSMKIHIESNPFMSSDEIDRKYQNALEASLNVLQSERSIKKLMKLMLSELENVKSMQQQTKKQRLDTIRDNVQGVIRHFVISLRGVMLSTDNESELDSKSRSLVNHAIDSFNSHEVLQTIRHERIFKRIEEKLEESLRAMASHEKSMRMKFLFDSIFDDYKMEMIKTPSKSHRGGHRCKLRQHHQLAMDEAIGKMREMTQNQMYEEQLVNQVQAEFSSILIKNDPEACRLINKTSRRLRKITQRFDMRSADHESVGLHLQLHVC